MRKALGWLGLGYLLVACAGHSTQGGSGAGGDSGEEQARNPLGPAAQGASTVVLRSASPAAAGKSCPAGAAATTSIPAASGSSALSGTSYSAHIVDGDGGAAMTCKVAGSSSFTFSAKLSHAGRVFEIKNGTLSADHRGSAQITIGDAQLLASSLSSPASCSINAGASGTDNFQIKPGSMWASFTCPSVAAEPSDDCAASGYFVLENCVQQ